MSRRLDIGRTRLVAAGLLIALAAFATPLVAGLAQEVGPHIVILGITEGPDPVGMVFWRPLYELGGSDGAWRGRSDGRPDVFVDPETGYPAAVWSYGIDDKFDVAYSRWDGSTWRDLEFLVEGSTDELEPRLYVNEMGDGYLVWWQVENGGTVYMSAMEAGGEGWSAPRVLATQAQRPSIINWGDRLMVVFERPTASGVDIVLHQEFGGTGYHQQILAKVSSTEPANPMIHRVGSTIWIDWLSEPGEYRWATMMSGSFNIVGGLSWADRSWSGDEAARAQIRDAVMPAR